MIRSQTLVLSFGVGRIAHQDSRPTYGKIKFAPPSGRQAIGMACLPAGASVGARAARSERRNGTNMDFGTRALPLVERADK